MCIRDRGEAVSAGADDLTLLAAIIECEAGGESYECQLAVGAAAVSYTHLDVYKRQGHAFV